MPSGRADGGTRLRLIAEEDPSTVFLKVADTDSPGAIVAIAKWNVYDGVVPSEEGLDGPGEMEAKEIKRMPGRCCAGIWGRGVRRSGKAEDGWSMSLELGCAGSWVLPVHVLELRGG